uniref:(California timema) hypothetical protein n=1 Tax=Timema californicum TaxID=61474 RepID=A0A7R9IYS2_TIMCA|nr:unnamed protein product [Timema californicum]
MPVRKGAAKRRTTIGNSVPLPPIVPPKKSKKSENNTSSIRLSTSRVSTTRVSILPVQPTTAPGVVLAFGQGDVGQLGLGSEVMERSRPALIPNLDNVTDVCAGGMHTICISSSGAVITFGCNDDGALGRDTSEEGSEFKPIPVELPDKAVQVSAGDSHSAALLEDGRVFAWGSFRDIHGTMGLTKDGIQNKPLELFSRIKVTKIASGIDHLVMLTEDGQLFTCGCGEQGQLGRVPERGAGRGDSRRGIGYLLEPALVKLHPRVKVEFDDVWAAGYSTYAREKNQGHIYVFGLNNYNQLGLPDQSSQYQPRLSESFSGCRWSKICGGQHHTLALDSEGTVHVLGRKEYGRLGLGKDCEDAKVPTVVPLLKNFKCVDVACGTAVSFAVTIKGELYSWGMGTNGQLGSGDDADLYEPALVQGKQLEGRSVLRATAGGQHTVVIATPAKL